MRVLQGHLSHEIGRRNIERPYVTELLRAFSMILHSPVSTHFIWRCLSLSELTPMIFNTGLTHLGTEASIYSWKKHR